MAAALSAYEELSVLERMSLKFEAEEFLCYEAQVLDERRYSDWLSLLTDDIHYWMPIRRTTTAREIDKEFTRPGDMAFFDENMDSLQMRVARLSQGRAWAEDPPSRTRHFFSNVRVQAVHGQATEGQEVTVLCNFCVYRSRLNTEEDRWVGRREDTLRRADGQFKLARRHLFLDQTLILAQNMSTFF